MSTSSLIHPGSLVRTLDAVNDALFFDRAIPKAQAREAVAWLAARRGGGHGRMIKGSYQGMPAPTAGDFEAGGKLFTGEAVGSHAGLACKFGFEACRAMLLLDSGAQTRRLVQATTAWVAKSQKDNARLGKPAGMFCCTSCSAAMWRLAAIGGLPKSDRLLSDGCKSLHRWRIGNGKWRSWPFYYTLLALSEADIPAARKELQYAAGACEKLITRMGNPHVKAELAPYAARRRLLLERVLAEV